jgi:two-component system OmpR family sensor kinase
MPIRWRITLWYTSILSLILFVLGTFLYLFFAHRETASFDQELAQTGNEIVRSIKIQDSFPFPIRQFVLPDMDIFEAPNIYLQAIDTRGEIVSRSANLSGYSLPVSRQVLRNAITGNSIYETVEISGSAVRIYSMPILYQDRIIGLLQIGGSLEPIEHSLQNLRLILLIGSVVTLMIVGSAAWFLAKRVLRPIDDVVKATSEIQRGKDLKKRIPYQGPMDEIGSLVDQSNQMFARLEKVYGELEESYQMQKRFVSDASHELRTPLTAIRGNIDFLLKSYEKNPEMIGPVLEDISNDIDRMTRLINHLLSLARADAGYQFTLEEIHLYDFMERLLPQFERMSREVEFKIENLEATRNVYLYGNRDYLHQLFMILMENGFKYTREGSVTLSFSRESGVRESKEWILITVKDTGIGIPAQDLPHIFERFYRGENATGTQGTGLGLPIARWIVEQHKGRIRVESEVGRGTTVTVYLPGNYHPSSY